MEATRFESIYRNPPGYDLDFDLLRDFENGLDPSKPEENKTPSQVLGYGEISTVFEIETAGFADLALKRMSIFEAPEELESYLTIYTEYHDILEGGIGIQLPAHGYAAFENTNGRPLFYIIQQKVAGERIGHKALSTLSLENARLLFSQTLQEMGKVWAFNQQQEHYQVGLDGQISNWAVTELPPSQSTLLYIDTSTPLYRENGVEQLDPRLFLRPAPSFLRWVLRRFFLDDVVNRYYDQRLVIVDLLANLYKEQLSYLVPEFIPIANNYFAEEMPDLVVEKITEGAVQAYYKEDKFIWSLYLSMRRLDRFIQNKLLRKKYPYVLPGKVNR